MKNEAHVIRLVLGASLAACGRQSALTASSLHAHAKFATRDPKLVTCKGCSKYVATLRGGR